MKFFRKFDQLFVLKSPHEFFQNIFLESIWKFSSGIYLQTPSGISSEKSPVIVSEIPTIILSKNHSFLQKFLHVFPFRNISNINKYSSRDSFKHLSGLISGNSSDSTILCFVIHEFSQHLSHYSISRSRCTVGFQSLLKLPPGSTAKCVGRSIITALHVLQLVPVAVFSGDGCAF